MIAVDIQLDRGDFALDIAFDTDAHVLGVFGPSGAGKTTLINLIAGLERPDAGSIRLNGDALFDAANRIDVPAHRRRIGVVFQEHRLFPHYSVTGNLLYGAKGNRGGLQSIIDLLELGPLMNRRTAQLSGGERQRVALGRALLSRPAALLLDEPLASLDVRLRRQIIPYLARVREALSIPIVYVSHDLSEILQLTDQVLVIESGRSVGCGRYTDIVHEGPVLSVVHDRGMTNILRARIAADHPEDGITTLVLGSASGNEQGSPPEIVAPLAQEPAGAEVTIAIQPWDIALALGRVEGTSIRNQIPGRVTRSTTHDRRVLVEVELTPGVSVIAEISRRSAETMKIARGRPVFCLIKSHAVRYAGNA